MSDLIRREDVFEALGITDKSIKYGGDHSGYYTMMLYEIKGAIDSIPTAEPKVGKWEECKVVDIEDTTITEVQSAFCPICHKYHTTPYMYYFDYFNYCPNCGAKMERSE